MHIWIWQANMQLGPDYKTPFFSQQKINGIYAM